MANESNNLPLVREHDGVAGRERELRAYSKFLGYGIVYVVAILSVR